MQFIEVNLGMAVNLDKITRIERLEGQALIYLGPDESVIADVPYETLIGLLNERSKEEPEQTPSEFGSGLQGFLEQYGQPIP